MFRICTFVNSTYTHTECANDIWQRTHTHANKSHRHKHNAAESCRPTTTLNYMQHNLCDDVRVEGYTATETTHTHSIHHRLWH